MILHTVVERNLKINYQQKLEHQKYAAHYYNTRLHSILDGLILSSAVIQFQNRQLTQLNTFKSHIKITQIALILLFRTLISS